VFLPAAEPIPASDVTDTTETGGLRHIKAIDRADPTPPNAAGVAGTTDAPAAVTTAGNQVESISPDDSLDTSTLAGEAALPAAHQPAAVSPTPGTADPGAAGLTAAPPIAGEAAG